MSNQEMWFDLRDVPRPDFPDVTTGEGYWYDSLMSPRLYTSWATRRDSDSDLQNCAVINSSSVKNRIWDDRDCEERH